MRVPKVKIAIICYNFAPYIGRAIESVLVQETNFPFTIFVVDDCSTDGSREIIQEYEKAFPEKIEAFFFPQNTCNMSLLKAIEAFRGMDYISILDGDDYWVGTGRLQKQVDFLEANPEFSMCAGLTNVHYNGEVVDVEPSKATSRQRPYYFADYFKDPDLFHTSAILCRNVLYSKGNITDDLVASIYDTGRFTDEDSRRMLHLEHGPIYAFDEVFSVYNLGTGCWSGQKDYQKKLLDLDHYFKILLHYHGSYPELYEYMYHNYKSAYYNTMGTLINERIIWPENKLTLAETELLTKAMLDMKKFEDIEDAINPGWRPFDIQLN